MAHESTRAAPEERLVNLVVALMATEIGLTTSLDLTSSAPSGRLTAGNIINSVGLEPRFVANAKIVGPGGDVLATTGTEGGLAIAGVDVDDALTTARRSMFHLRDRRPGTYAPEVPVHA